MDLEAGSASNRRAMHDIATLRVGEHPYNREAESSSADRARSRSARERLEQPPSQLVRHSWTVIGHSEREPIGTAIFYGELDLVASVTHRVDYEVREYLFQLNLVCDRH